MRAAWLRLQEWGERRLPALTRHRLPEHLPIELGRRRIYILPSGFGIGFTILLLIMLVGALNYANNAALLLTCLLGAVSSNSMLMTFRGLDGLRLIGIRAGQAIAGQPLELSLSFAAARPRGAIRLDVGKTATTFAIDATHNAEVTVALATTRRGWQAVPRMRVWSSWPIGLFCAWSWLLPAQSVLVWPQPEASGPSPRLPADEVGRSRLLHGDDVASLRDYRRGDSQRHIAWKASARHEHLLAKNFERPETRLAWALDWRQLAALEPEARIARLARWLGEASAQGRHYSLWLPGESIETDSGVAHYVRCMNALAVSP